MGNELSIKFDVERAFRVMDEADGKPGDGKIQASIWNEFAEIAKQNGRIKR